MSKSSEALIKRHALAILQKEGLKATLRIYPQYTDFIKESNTDIQKAIKTIEAVLYGKA